MAKLVDRVLAKPPHQPPYVIEDVETLSPRKLFSFLGVEWLGTSVWWVAPMWIVGLGILISFLVTSAHSSGKKLLTGFGYALLIAFSIVMHQVGQILAGRMVGAPMKAVVFTATLAYQLYADPQEYPSRVHLVRALGGPSANLLTGIVMLIVYLALGRRRFALFLSVVNLAFTLAALTPLPTMDGGAVLHELRHWRSSSD